MKITDLLFDAVNDPGHELNKNKVIQGLTTIGNQLIKDFKNKSELEITQNFLKSIDTLMEKELADHPPEKTISCSKGCFACCYSMVTVTDVEARLLLSYCKENDINIDPDKLTKQANHNLENWMELDLKDRKCAFLDEEGACSVYEARPGVCRKHLVTAKPDQCVASGTLPKNERIFNVDVELMISALWQVRPQGNMAQMLKAEMAQSATYSSII